MFRTDRALHAMHKIAMQKAAAVGLPGESAPTTNPNAKAPPPPKSTGGPSISSYDPRTATISRAMRAHPDSPWPVRQVGKALDTAPAQAAIGATARGVAAVAKPVADTWDAVTRTGSKYVGTPLRKAVYRAQGVPAQEAATRVARGNDAKSWRNSTEGARVKVPETFGGGDMRISPYDVAFLGAPGGTAMQGTRLAAGVGKVTAKVPLLKRFASSGLADLSASTYAGNVNRAASHLAGKEREMAR